MPNPKAEALKKTVNSIIDKWADELLASFQGKGSDAPKPRGLWDRIKSGFYGLFKGDTKENPYYYKNRFGDYLGANESVSPICLHDYLHLKSVVEQAEMKVSESLNEDSMEKLRLFKIVRQASEDLKRQIRDAIDAIATPVPKTPVPSPSPSSSSSYDSSSSSAEVSLPTSQPEPGTTAAAASASEPEPEPTLTPASAASPTAGPELATSSSSSYSRKKRTGPVTMPASSKKAKADPELEDLEAEVNPHHHTVEDDPRPSEAHAKKQTAAMRMFLDFGKVENESVRKFPGPPVDAPWFYNIAKIRENMEELFDLLEEKIKENKRKDVIENIKKRWSSEDKSKLINYIKTQFINSFDVSDEELIGAIEKVAGEKPAPELDDESMKILNGI